MLEKLGFLYAIAAFGLLYPVALNSHFEEFWPFVKLLGL